MTRSLKNHYHPCCANYTTYAYGHFNIEVPVNFTKKPSYSGSNSSAQFLSLVLSTTVSVTATARAPGQHVEPPLPTDEFTIMVFTITLHLLTLKFER